MNLRLLKLSFLLCALTLSLGVKAQWNFAQGFPEVTFSGKLVDSLTKEPLSAAVISVVTQDHKTGDKFIRNCVSDKKGDFSFVCRLEPRHRMEVAMLGYKPYVRELTMLEREQNLGVILMSQSTQSIDEVVVKSRLQMYKMRGDTLIYMPRAVNTMRDDAALEILRQMPGVEVDANGGVKILGKQVERTYVNEKLLFGEDPTTALKELDAKEVASIEAYDEVDEADAVANGKNARKRKVLNVVTFKEFTQSYSAKARGEMGTDFSENAEGERPIRYLGTGNVNFFSEALQITASGGADNLTAEEGVTSAYASRRKSFADANVSGTSNQHHYKAGYSYNGGANAKRSSSTGEYFPTDYFTTQHVESTERQDSESGSHALFGDYSYTGERTQFSTRLRASFSNGSDFSQSNVQTMRDGKNVSANNIINNNRSDTRLIDWQASGSRRFKNGNSLSVSLLASLNDIRTRGVRSERRTTDGVETPLDWDAYSPLPDNKVDASVSYKFNFDRAGNLRIGSGIRYDGCAERKLYTDLQTGAQDLVRSEDAFDKTIAWSANSEYLLRGENYNFWATLKYTLENRAYEDAIVGRTDRRDFHFVSGSINYSYNKPKKNFSVSFSNGYMPVQARYFSSRLNDSNPLYVSTGNSSLVPEQTYTFAFRSEFLGENASYGFSTQVAAITDPTIYRRRFFKEATPLPEYDNYLMPAGSTLTSPENGAAYLRLGVGANYKVRIAPLRLFLDMEVGYSFSNEEEMLYDQRERIARHGVNLTTRLTTNFSKKFRINVTNTAGVNFLKRFGNASRDFRDVLTGSVEWDVLQNLYLKGNYTGIFSSSSAMLPTPDTHLLSLTLGYRVLKERGRIAINAYDVLNDYSPVRVSQTLDGVFRTVEYVGANYFTISFEYKFNNRSAAK